jgi:hypothetical protein
LTLVQASFPNAGAAENTSYAERVADESWVRIAELPEAGEHAGRVGQVFGWSVPSSSGVGPVIGAHVGGSAKRDFAYSVFFEDSGEQLWFAPHLLESAGDATDRSRLG